MTYNEIQDNMNSGTIMSETILSRNNGIITSRDIQQIQKDIPPKRFWKLLVSFFPPKLQQA